MNDEHREGKKGTVAKVQSRDEEGMSGTHDGDRVVEMRHWATSKRGMRSDGRQMEGNQ